MTISRTFGRAALALALVTGGAARAQEPVLDGIAAQVGSDIVLVSEVRNLVGPMEKKMKEAGAPESELAALRQDALERLIERALIRQVVRRVAAPDLLRWTDHSARAAGGAWGVWAPGRLGDRCFSHTWPG